MKHAALVSLTSIFLVVGLGNAFSQNPAPRPPSNNWLLDAPDDAERLRLLQQYLRGFDQPMWEVGERYEQLHEALTRENYDLAAYHWDKIKVTIQNGYLKRPARKANSDALFLDRTWAEVDVALKSRDGAKAWAGFEVARKACMSCHDAEKVPFMNNQPMLRDLAAPAGR